MTYIELPRAVEAYFAFAELPANGRGRQFTITFTYFEGARLDRLQWWWQVSKAQERAGDAQLQVQNLRQQAITRFKLHIERWLINGGRCLRGGEPFPQLEALTGAVKPAEVLPPPPPPPAEDDTEQVYVDKVREYARMAVGG
jgi:hypothetical protein